MPIIKGLLKIFFVFSINAFTPVKALSKINLNYEQLSCNNLIYLCQSLSITIGMLIHQNVNLNKQTDM